MYKYNTIKNVNVNAAAKYKFQIIKNACHENVLLYNGNKTFITMTN